MGSSLPTTKKILNSASKYYKNLYSSKINMVDPNITEQFFSEVDIPKLSEDERLNCEGQIATEECVNALDTFENGKTPGNDGIPAEFYKTFWSSIGEILTDVFNHSFDAGQMSNSQKQVIISLIDKLKR